MQDLGACTVHAQRVKARVLLLHHLKPAKLALLKIKIWYYPKRFGFTLKDLVVP